MLLTIVDQHLSRSRNNWPTSFLILREWRIWWKITRKKALLCRWRRLSWCMLESWSIRPPSAWLSIKCRDCGNHGHFERYCWVIAVITRENKSESNAESLKKKVPPREQKPSSSTKEQRSYDPRKKPPMKGEASKEGKTTRRSKFAKTNGSYTANEDEGDKEIMKSTKKKTNNKMKWVAWWENFISKKGMYRIWWKNRSILWPSLLYQASKILWMPQAPYHSVQRDVVAVRANVRGIAGNSLSATVEGRLPIVGDCPCIPKLMPVCSVSWVLCRSCLRVPARPQTTAQLHHRGEKSCSESMEASWSRDDRPWSPQWCTPWVQVDLQGCGEWCWAIWSIHCASWR